MSRTMPPLMMVAQDVETETFAWFTPARCRALFVIWLIVCAVGNVVYLNHFCPFDLAGDEAQYWDWSRHLELSYYSKGPMVAYIIRGSCAIFGETMQAVRYPAILLSTCTAIFAYLLTLKLFRSDRLALGAVLLSAAVPIFIFGGVFMTIDAPLFFCWAGATYFGAIAIFDRKMWAWVIVGIFTGLGFLSKYAMFLWIPSIFGFVLADAAPSRKRQMGGAVAATIVALLFTIPVILWNQQHGWVSVRHVAHQTGTSGGSISHGNFLELIASQLGALDPLIAVFIVLAVIYTIRSNARDEPNLRQLRLLAWIGLPFFLLTALSSFLAKAQANWPAPAYFSLVILAAYFLSMRSWDRCKGWIIAAIVIGLIATPIARDPSIVFPLARINHKINPGPMLSKLVGWKILGDHVGDELKQMPAGTFVLCDDYMQTAECAFYVRGQPKTYCAGPYYLSDPKRLTQYDMWKDRALTPMVDGQPNPLLGRDCVYVGKGGEIPPEIPAAFDRIEKLPPIHVIVRGYEVKSFKLWRCYGFKGMSRPSAQQNF